MNFKGNVVDYIVVGFLFLMGITSIGSGFIFLCFEFLGFILALFGAINLYFFPAIVLSNYLSVPRAFANPIGFFIVWVFIEAIYFFLVRQGVKLLPKELFKSKWDKLLAFIPALANGFAVVAFSLLLFVSLPIPGEAKQLILNSKIGGPMVSFLMKYETPVKNIFGDAVQQGLTFLTVKRGSHDSVNLGFTQSNLATDEQSEKAMFDLLNQERVLRGLPSLKYSTKLAEVARGHSTDMLKRGYFSHYSPEGEDVSARLGKAGIFPLIAGENLAYAPSVRIAHEGLINSEGHRANILDKEYTKIGIGVIDGGIYGKMFTQVFSN